jgi:hypothetical protein
VEASSATSFDSQGVQVVWLLVRLLDRLPVCIISLKRNILKKNHFTQ